MKQTSFRIALVTFAFALMATDVASAQTETKTKTDTDTKTAETKSETPAAVQAAARAEAQASVARGAINPYACGPLNPPGQYGPFDYRTAPPDVKHRVEDYHFTAEVESLRKGNTATLAGADLDYTLRALPNNPRALLAVGRYGMKMKSDRASGLRYSVECYFERAVRFMPNDPMAHVMYANFLKDRKRNAEAKSQLEQAEQVRGDPSNFDLDYNLGLLYYDVGVYDKSLDAAKRAYALGAPLPALMNKLKASGKWKE